MATVREIVSPIADKVDAAADAMKKANVGGHPTRGHESLLRRISASLRSDAAMGKTPHEFVDGLGGLYAAADADPKTAFAALPGPLRHMLTKHGCQGELTEQGGISLSHLEAASQNASPEDRIYLKANLAKLGLLRAA